MTDKVQKILSEIATRKLCTMDEHMAFYNDKVKEDYRLLSDIEELIKTLQEEPVSESLDIESMIESYKQRLISQVNGMKNSPFVNMCLDSYKHGINETLDTLNLSNIQRTIKDSKKEPVSEELEEAVNAYIGFAPEVDKCSSVYGKRQAFKAGAKWQKEQLKSSAIDATIGYWNHSGLSIDVKLPKDLKEGSKCKILIIKDK